MSKAHYRNNSKSFVRKYGHIKSAPDHRDLTVKFTDDHIKAFALDNKVSLDKLAQNDVFDLRTIVKLPQALSDIDQGSLGSCTANAIAFAYAFDELKQSNKDVFLPSRLFIYYNERLIEGTVDQDAGADIRDGMKSIKTYGVCEEHHWIYDPVKFAVKPPDNVYTEAKNAQAVSYARIDLSADSTIDARVAHMKKTLQSGFPIVFGFTVFDSFETDTVARTGMVPMPTDYDQEMGGHAVCAVGFDDNKKCFIVKNSWGASWGINGYFYMPYNYMGDPNLASGFWIITAITNPIIENFVSNDITPDAINLNVSAGNGGVVNN